MKTINLILALHNHQPLGNFDSVFAEAHRKAYVPFLDMLDEFPAIRVGLHYSGTLLDWLKRERPEFIKRLAAVVARGQAEIIGGAYYEAILSVIPDRDKVSQIEKMSRELEKLVGCRPTGFWLAERVWEQHLARFLAESGMRYVAVDDTHFKYAGLVDRDLTGYYMTEEGGRSLAIFPISKKLRYSIPFQPVSSTIEHLRALATEEGDRIAVYADDGEKFGVWPKTYEHVYGSGWMRDFLRALKDNRDWITVMSFSEALQTLRPKGRIYLPNASYAEMMHWSLPAEQFHPYEECEEFLRHERVEEKFTPFFKGGFWRNFLVKYAEANTLHKKMLHVSERLHRAANRRSFPRKQVEVARNHLLAAQCNDAYWHGVFGGLYLPVLRYPLFHHLIAAEGVLDAIEKRKGVLVTRVDFDCDGREELLVESPVLNCYIKPDEGGSVFELDFKPISLNLTDVMTRREEGYHHKLRHAAAPSGGSGTVASIHDVVLTKEEGLERYLKYDWYRRASLLDHFFGQDATLERVANCEYPEVGDFVNRPYAAAWKSTSVSTTLTLTRQGALWLGERRHRLTVRKSITFLPGRPVLEIAYRLKNEETFPVDVWFGVEFNIGLQAGDAPDRYYYSDGTRMVDRRLRSKGEVEGRSIGLRDEYLGVDVRIEASRKSTFWRFPVETISLSEEGFERIYQGSAVIPHWRFRLERFWGVKLIQRISQLA